MYTLVWVRVHACVMTFIMSFALVSAESPQALSSLECYVSVHSGSEWLRKLTLESYRSGSSPKSTTNYPRDSNS